MSVTKAGTDDATAASPTRTSCTRPSAGSSRAGITVVAAAANDSRSASQHVPAAYNEVITVSALADTDGKPGGLGGNRCYSWGGYDNDDTFADFSNYGARRRHHRPGQVHLVDRCPGRLRLLVGHVDGGAGRHRRRRALQGEPPERDAGRGPRGAPVPRQPELEDLDRPGLRPTSRCSTSRSIGALGTFASTPGRRPPPRRGRRRRRRARHDRPQRDVLRARQARRHVPARAAGPRLDATSLIGWTANARPRHGHGPDWHAAPARTTSDHGHEPGPQSRATVTVMCRRRPPTAKRRRGIRRDRRRTADRPATVRVVVAGRDRSHPARSPATRSQRSTDGGPWGSTIAVAAPTARSTVTPWRFGTTYGSASAPSTAPATGARGPAAALDPRPRRRRSQLGSREYTGVVDADRRLGGIGDDAAPVDQPARDDRYTFTGRGIALVAPTSPGRGKVQRVHRWRLRQDRSSLRDRASATPPGRLRAVPSPSGGTHKITLDVTGRPVTTARSQLDAIRRAAGSRSQRAHACARCAMVTLPTPRAGYPRRDRRQREVDSGTSDVEGGHPVRAGHHPGQALSRDRVQGHQLQHAPQGRTCRGSR